ncbi:hypothetical protein Cob_v009979 [Colletotrichum orbiculare MAFF 240422]|uniref:Uncharacterized protein n=1 Tax=Colletotrichum orbiculare (strain 104-T / ATCC 96160 / CBS 514.97 / LARS 414 / MAFF 240422) TaxID=1213857 RepID=N4VDE4_COLOR|nr:hypothetical protein Cob_v009979 [Colletotrichum orbiculare MAFF 240422]
MSTRRNGLFQPEYRLFILSIPIVSVILECVFLGQAGAYPDRRHWMAVVAPHHFGYFAFLGASLVGITYVIDSFPNKAGPLLLVICAGPGFHFFQTELLTVPLIKLTG